MRLQLFAEALHRLKAKEQFWPTREQERELVFPEQERFKKEERWEDYLNAYVNAPATTRRSRTTAGAAVQAGLLPDHRALRPALQIKADRIDGAGQMDNRIANAMKALGFVKHRESSPA
jgi:putative DNA primase/helicase